MKQETKIDTPKNLEARITAALANSTEITSTDLAILLQETENVLSETAIKIERERAFDLTKSPDATTAHRTLTENEVIRGRLKLVLPDLQHKLEAVCEQERTAQWEQEFLRVEIIRDKAAEKWARVPEIIDELIQLFREDEAIKAECSRVNGSAPNGEMRRLVGPELKARGLDSFSRGDPSMAKVTQLPDFNHSELMLWPPRPSFIPRFGPAPSDIHYTDQWGLAADRQRRLANEKIDRELAEAEAAKREFYRPR